MTRRIAIRLFTAIGVILSGGALLASLSQARSARGAQAAAEAHRPREVHDQSYVSSSECRSCHPREYASWARSFHRSMTRLATPETVFGRFAGVLGKTPAYALGRDEEGFHVDFATTAGAPRERHPITLVTGSHHMQIYWYETGHDRNLGQLPYAYLNADRRWVPRNAIFLEPPTPLVPANDGRWNASCIACHTTLGQPRIDATGRFDTKVAEFGIACEACHGPGEEHVARNRSPLARYRQHLGGSDGEAAIVQPKKLTHQRASYVCAQCHATWLYDSPASMHEWNEHGSAFRPGGDPPASVWLMQPSRAGVDPRIAEVVEHEPAYVAGQFWSDGVMRVSGREFNGMVESPCYERGELACTSCHAMHQNADDTRPAASFRVYQLIAGMDGDRGCIQCHRAYAEEPEKHTHHARSSEGSRCYNCHMPYTSYGLLKALRNHRIDVPSVDATLKAGRPNACNLCHLDKSLAWTARQLETQYGIKSPALGDDEAKTPLALLLGLRGDAGQRALVAFALGWAPAHAASRPAFAVSLLGTLMDDPYDAVRYIAARSLRSLGLHDPSYDFVQRPAQRAAVAPRIAMLAKPAPTPDERARMLALFERLLRERDEKPVRLLE